MKKEIQKLTDEKSRLDKENLAQKHIIAELQAYKDSKERIQFSQ